MHKQSSNMDGQRMDGGGGNMSGNEGSFCQCGCGQWLTLGYGGKPRKYVLGHQCKSRSQSEWSRIHGDVIGNAPICQCGCGKQVSPTHKTLASFINSRGSRKYPKFLYGHDKCRCYARYHFDPTPEEQSAIIGTCLGDSCLQLPHRRSRNYRLCANHSSKQQEWVLHKTSFLHRYGFSVSNIANPGYGETLCRMVSKCLPPLSAIAVKIYDGRTKVATIQLLELLGSIGLAWWICDDGSSSRGILRLHTEGWTKPQNDLMATWFSSQDLQCSVHFDREYPYLLFTKRASAKLAAQIFEFVPMCMRYKLVDCC